MSSVQKETLHFEVDSHHLIELGERLVAKPSIALAELVKNAYDADATFVKIKFMNVSKLGGTINVEDDGEGMNLYDIKTKWIRIGTDYKDRNPISTKYRRTRTGRKGIGRFACRLISNKLVLTSVSNKEGQFEKVSAFLDWDKLEPGKLVEEFTIEVGREKVPSSTATGTRLELSGVKSSWSKEDIESFTKEILGLVNPFPWETKEKFLEGPQGQDPGFKVFVEAPEYPDVGAPLSEEILASSWGRLEGKIDEDGNPRYNLMITDTKENYEFCPSKKFGELGRASFVIYLFSYKGSPDMSGLSLGTLRRLGRLYGGVKVFLDGFRVFRYGEPGDDWLKLEFDRSQRHTTTPKELVEKIGDLKRPMLSLPGNNQLFGAVFLSRKSNPSIHPTVTRDRLLENKAFDDLAGFTRLGIDWMTIRYAAYRARERKDKAKTRPKTDAVSVLGKIEDIIDEHEEDLDTRTSGLLLDYVNLAREELIKQREESISQISMLRILASTGTMISVFDHEISVIIRRLGEIASDFQKFLEFLPFDRQDSFRVVLAELRAWGSSVTELSSMIGLMLGKNARLKKKALSIHNAVNNIFDPFKQYMEDNNIKPVNEVPVTLRTPPMYESELQSVLVNLMTNSIKAFGEKEIKQICVKGEDTESEVRILFLDTGIGLQPERWEEVFEPFVSYSMPSLDFGVGTGLGLTIVRDIIESYGGKVKFTLPPNGWNTCVVIDLPKVNIDE